MCNAAPTAAAIVILVNEGANALDFTRSIVDMYKPRKRIDVGTWGVMGIGMGFAVAALAKVLGVKQLNCLVGIRPEGVSEDAARKTLVENLKFAAKALKAEKIDLLIEPINTFDIPGFYLSRTQQALDLINDVDASNLYVQYDIYHMQRMEGEVANTLKRHLDKIKHVQLADNPGRNEPGTGEINYQFLFRWLDEIGYKGWVGCEYKPKAGTVEGLGWRAAHHVA